MSCETNRSSGVGSPWGEDDQVVSLMGPTEQHYGILIRVLLQPARPNLVPRSEISAAKILGRLSSWLRTRSQARKVSPSSGEERPNQCWRCRTILSRRGQIHDGKHQNLVLISSTLNCELNHDLLAVARLCLRHIATVPNKIRVESTSQGYLCLVLEQSLQDDLKIYDDAIPSPEAGEVTLTAHSNSGSVAETYDVYQYFKAPVTAIPEYWVPKGPEIPPNARDSECLEVARRWLQTCQQDHPECRVHGLQELPTRVLDVSGKSVRLHIPTRGSKGSWIALSYCWGTEKMLKTTTNNIESHKMGIAWHSLPKTHQDAVAVTRALGLQYLWIDSLCIIQDDGGSDFRAEAAKMCDVYRYSSLTISAACSTSGDKGFLWERAKSESFSPNPKDPTRFQSLRCRPAIDHRRMIREEPIHSRAWTFQETILPRRLLSFCSREVIWECETLKQCECWRIHDRSDSGETYDDMGRAAYRRYTKSIMLDGYSAGKRLEIPESHAQAEFPNPNGQEEVPEHLAVQRQRQYFQFFWAPYLEEKSLGQYRLKLFLQDIEQDRPARVTSPENRAKSERVDIDDQPELEAFFHYWRQPLVPEYTRRIISKDEDRLIALQAVAGDIHSRIRDQYCAGLWRKDLIRQLCWKSQSGGNTAAANQSPSWSWSSIRGPILPCLNAITAGRKTTKGPGDMQVVEVTCNTLNSNPCRQILGGCVKLRAWALDVQAIRNRESGRIEFLQMDRGVLEPIKPQMQFFPDTPLQCGKGQPLLRHREDDQGSAKDHVSEASQDKLPEPGAKALLLLVQENNGCVLVCSPTSSKAEVFRRVGIGLFPLGDGDIYDILHTFVGHFTGSMTLRLLDLI